MGRERGIRKTRTAAIPVSSPMAPRGFARPAALGIQLLLLVLAACSSYPSDTATPPVPAASVEQRRLDDPRLRSFLAAALPADEVRSQPGWGLARLTLAAVYYHPDIAIAEAKLVLARAGVITAGQIPNPTLDFALAAGMTSPEGLPLTIGPAIKFLIETFGKREYRIGQAQQLADAARWNVATASWQVRARVRSALLKLWAARRRSSEAKRRLAFQDQLVTLLEHRQAAGEASALDVGRERINSAQMAAALQEIEKTADEARAQLAAAVGVPLRALDDIRISIDAFDRLPPDVREVATSAWRDAALKGRTDVRAGLAEYTAAQEGLRLQIANRYPNVVLGPGYNYDFGEHKFLLNPSVDLPIFNQNQGPIAEALARRQQAATAFTALQARIVAEIDAAATALAAARKAVAIADGYLASAERREAQVRSLFRAGGADRPTLLTAQLETAAVRLSRLDAVASEAQAIGALEDALQQPLFEPDFEGFAPPAPPSATGS